MSGVEAQTFFELFIQHPADEFVLLAQSGSARKNYLAAAQGTKYIVTENAFVEENESFFYYSGLFQKLGLNTPSVLKISEDRKMYVQEFLGNKTLSEILAEEGLTERTRNLVRKVLTQLYHLQVQTAGKVDFSQAFEYEHYDDLPIASDLFYFKSFIVDVLELPYRKAQLLKEFKKLSAQIENLEPRGLMLRDFQARNIMVDGNDQLYFIDYQSAMAGPLIYDVISFLFQAKADFPAEFQEEMLEFYYQLWTPFLQSSLRESLKPLQLIRFLQVLGAYGFRGLVQKKGHFKASLWKGIENLGQFQWAELNSFPELQKIITLLQAPEVKVKIENLM